MLTLAKRLVREEEGQTLAEYALILGLIAIVAVLALTNLGTKISDALAKVKDEIKTAP